MGKKPDTTKRTSKQYKYLGLLTILYVTVALVSQITAGKISQIWIFSISAATVFFPVTYILADVFTEVYGYAQARSRTQILLLCSILSALLFALVAWLPPAPGFDANHAYVRVFSQIPRIAIAGWIAVYFGSITNDYILAKMKIWTKGKHLWARTIGSTVVGEAVDTVLIFTIGFYGIIPNGLLVSAMLSGWFIKVLIEVVMTPVTYKVVAKLKKVENEDYYDAHTDFNPLVIKNQ